MAVEQARGGQPPRPGADTEQVRAPVGPAGEPSAQGLFFPPGRGDYGRDHDHVGFGCRARVHVGERIVGHYGQPAGEHRGRAGGHRVHEEPGRAGEDLVRPERIGDDRAAGAEHHRDGQAALGHWPWRRPAFRWGGSWRPRVGRPHRHQRPGGTGPRHGDTGQPCRAQAAGEAARQGATLAGHLSCGHVSGVLGVPVAIVVPCFGMGQARIAGCLDARRCRGGAGGRACIRPFMRAGRDPLGEEGCVVLHPAQQCRGSGVLPGEAQQV